MSARSYSEKLKDPRWQKKRLTILDRDKWQCRLCRDSEMMLVVHHRIYLPGQDPWDYPDMLLITLCQPCHEGETADRPAAERRLLDTLRSRLFSDDLDQLVSAFERLPAGEEYGEWALALDMLISGRLIISKANEQLEGSVVTTAEADS